MKYLTIILIILFIQGCTKEKPKKMYEDEDDTPQAVVVTPTPSPIPSPTPTQEPTPVATEQPKPDPNDEVYEVDEIGGCDGTGLCGTTGKLNGKWASMEVRRPVKAIYHHFKEDK